jgi:hypothetical protein
LSRSVDFAASIAEKKSDANRDAPRETGQWKKWAICVNLYRVDREPSVTGTSIC